MDKKAIKQITELLEKAESSVLMIDGTVCLYGSATHILAGLSTIVHAIRRDTDIEDKDILKAVNMAMEDGEDIEEKAEKLIEILKMMKDVINK